MALEEVDLENFNFPFTKFDFAHPNFPSEWRLLFIFLCMNLLI